MKTAAAHPAEVIEIANDIAAICAGRPSSAVYMAISMVLGGAAARAPRPDFDGMMTLVERTARYEFNHSRAN